MRYLQIMSQVINKKTNPIYNNFSIHRDTYVQKLDIKNRVGTQVEVARPKWPLIRRVSSAHMFPVRSNYMVWKRLRAHFCLDNGLELAWSEATLFWDGLIRGYFGLERSDQRQFQAHTSLIRGRFERTLVWPETNSSDIFSSFFCFLTDFCCLG